MEKEENDDGARRVLVAPGEAPGAERQGKAAYGRFSGWRQAHQLTADWGKATAAYRAGLKTGGKSDAPIAAVMEAIETDGEAELNDEVYRAAPSFRTSPNVLLAEAMKGRQPGRALDVGMGQGRNSIFLASHGWEVTGFDVSKSGVDAALRAAQDRGQKLEALHSSDVDFDFGENQWDRIALLYVIETRSVQRVRKALRPGGIVVVEAGHH